MSEPRRSLVIVLCVIVHEGDILLLRRNKPPYRGFWSLPGGKMHFGESVTAAALREGREETGLDLSFTGLLGVATEEIRDPAGEESAHFVLFVTHLAPGHRDARSSAEGELRWMPLETLDAIEMIPSDRIMVRRFLEGAGEGSPLHFVVKRDGGEYAMRCEECL